MSGYPTMALSFMNPMLDYVGTLLKQAVFSIRTATAIIWSTQRCVVAQRISGIYTSIQKVEPRETRVIQHGNPNIENRETRVTEHAHVVVMVLYEDIAPFWELRAPGQF